MAWKVQVQSSTLNFAKDTDYIDLVLRFYDTGKEFTKPYRIYIEELTNGTLVEVRDKILLYLAKVNKAESVNSTIQNNLNTDL
jgi:hypothetical protein